MNKTIDERLLGNTSLQLWCLGDSFPLFACSFYGEGDTVFSSKENITKFYWSTSEASVFFWYIFCCCCSFLSWVYVLIAVWCLVESVFTCHLSGLQPISKQEKVWIEMEVMFFSSFFFSNNINFTAFYGYHPTITLWFSFISFNFLLWKYVTKMLI